MNEGQFKGVRDPKPPWLALICPACGRPLARAAHATWALCCCHAAPLTPRDLLGDPSPPAVRVPPDADPATTRRGKR